MTADFRFRVGADYSEFLTSTRGVISGLRGELESLKNQATLHVTTQTTPSGKASIAGIQGALTQYQGQGLAALDEAYKRGAINQTQYNNELARLAIKVEETRESLSTRAGRNIPAPDPQKVEQIRGESNAAYEAARAQEARSAERAAAAKQREAEESERAAGAQAELRASVDRFAALNERQAALMAQGMSAQEARNAVLTEVATTEFQLAARTRQLEAQGVATAQARQQAERELLAAERQRAIAEKEAADAAVRQVGQQQAARIGAGGSLFQRIQAFIASRPGGTQRTDAEGNPAVPNPQDFQSFGQFFTSKALTTGGFFLSGAVLYGGIQAFRETIREASSLQRELAIVKNQFDTVGGAADDLGRNTGFDQFAKQAVQISVDTGIAADEVVRVSRQLAGVFKTDTGLPDFNRALSETNTALKLAQVTGLPYQEITDSLTAITTTYHASFGEIGDLAIGLEQKFGVLAPELIRFTADLAPTAKQLGFTLEQITALGAVAQQRSGVSGSALAESFNRALPTLQQQAAKLVELFGQRPETENLVDPILSALSEGRGGEAIEKLTAAYAHMTNAQRNALAEMLGGQRNAKAFFAVLDGGRETIDALNGVGFDFGGKLDQRFKDFQSTVEFAFEQAKRSLEQFGVALFNSGIADGLKLIADNGAVLIQFLTQVIGLFSSFNDAMLGIPVKLAAITLALKGITALAGTLRLGGLLSILGAGGGGIQTGAELTARQQSSPILRNILGAQTTYHLANSNAALPVGVGEQEVTATAGKFRTAMAGALESLAPAIAAVAVGALVQTVQNVRGQTKEQITGFDAKVADLVKQGLAPDVILNKIKQAGGGESSKIDQLLNFGQETNQVTEGLNEIQRQRAGQQGEEMGLILKGADERQRQQLAQIIAKSGAGKKFATETPQLVAARLAGKGGLEGFVQDFLKDPANDDMNAAIARMIEFARNGGASPETIAQLKETADKYAAAYQDAGIQDVQDNEQTLADIQTRYQAGDATLHELVIAEQHQINLLREKLAIITDPTLRAQLDQQLAQHIKEQDDAIKQAAQKTADLSIKLAGVRGENVATATFDARMQQLRSLISQGASPETQADAALSALDAQQGVLNQLMNAPVIVNGIARAPTTAEKLARAAKGVPISPELRQAIVRASILTGEAAGQVQDVAKASGEDMNKIIDAVARVAVNSDRSIVNSIEVVLDNKIKNVQREIANLTDPEDKDTRQRAQQALVALQNARAEVESLANTATSFDPGDTYKADTTDLNNQNLIDQSNEQKAIAEAYANLLRAQAHGDPIAIAYANMRAAQTALSYANASGKQSEVIAAQAQLQEAQNALEDANEGVVQAQYQFAISQARGNPAAQALLRIAALREAATHVHSEAERLNNLGQQGEAEQALADALNAVVTAQISLAEAVATAAGDSVKAAQINLWNAATKMNQLLASGADPNGAAVLDAQAQVVAANAAVRDQQLQTQERDIDFALQMERITTGQAIAQLEALLQIPNLTVEQTQQILLKIKQLKDELGRDLQFNLPGDIRVPTLYEVRRLNQSPTPTGPGTSYQDNRNVNVVVYATTNATGEQIGAGIQDAMGSTRVNGVTPGKFGLGG